MTPRSRLPILLAAVVVIVAAFLFLRPDDEKEQAGAPTTTPTTTSSRAAKAEPAKTTAEKPAAPAVKRTRIEIVDATPIEGVKNIRATKGETLALTVDSDVADEVHLHGYDISRDVAPGKPATLKFKANIEGIFEIELENRAIEVASLRVDP